MAMWSTWEFRVLTTFFADLCQKYGGEEKYHCLWVVLDMGWKPTLDQRSLTPPGVWLGRIGMVNFGTKVTINNNNRVHLHQ